MIVDELIDRFVELINISPREAMFDYEVPPELRLTVNEHGWWDWQVKASDDIDWIESLETRLSMRFPPSFRSLVTRYQFPAIVVGPLILCSNTSSGTYDELRDRIFRDELLSDCLLLNGLVQFALPDTGSYDPICFDTRRPTSAREFPIVQLDHEDILCNEQICTVKEVAPSFHEFVSTYLTSR